MAYERVIPRDFFNEAKLLKCMGQLSLLIEDRALPEGVRIKLLVPSYTGFFIVQDPADAGLYIHNCSVFVNEKRVIMKSVYNSKAPYPLLCEYKNSAGVHVFNDDGTLTSEFIEFARNLKKVQNAG